MTRFRLMRPLGTVIAAALLAVTTIAGAQAADKIPPDEISPAYPFKANYIEVHGASMHYVDVGDAESGDVFLFLHGQPTSSYLWRNIIPHVTDLGRAVAPDFVGFGRSDKPDIDYTYLDHRKYVDGFIEAMGLSNIILVIHDWGSALGFDYAMRHPDNVKGIAFMEAVVEPIFPAASYEAMPKPLAEFFTTMRDPVLSKKLNIDQNYFVEKVLTGFTSRDIDDTAMTVYREPFLDPADRLPVWRWPLEVPIGGEPPYTAATVADYNAWLRETEMPKLMLYAKPGALNPPQVADHLAAVLPNLETVYIGHGLHYVQEDQPYAIGRGIRDWYRRNLAQ